MLARSLVLFACFLAGAGFVARAERPEAVPERGTFSSLPLDLDGWRGRQEPALPKDILAVLGVDDYLTRTYYRERAGIGVYIGYYGSQRQGDTMHSPQNCLPGAGWEFVNHSLVPVTVAADAAGGTRDVVVNRYLIRKGLDQQLVLYWYQSRGRIVGSEYWSKIYLVLDAARYNRTDAALVRLVVPLANGSAEAEARAESQAIEFANVMLPALGAFLPN